MRLSVPIALSLGVAASPAFAQAVELSPLFATQLRYEQFSTDKLLGTNDAVLLRARPGLGLSSGNWAMLAESDAAVALRRPAVAGATTGIDALTGTSGASIGGRPPEALQLNQLRVQYLGLPGTAISFGRQQLGLADASLTGDRDGEQTFDAARIRWSALPGLTADLAYAWSSRSLYAGADGNLLPGTVEGANLFARVDWQSALGTLSGYAYQVDQGRAANRDFHLLNQVYGARLAGDRKLGEALKLGYSVGYTRQTGSLVTSATGAPVYWQMGSAFDFGDLTGSRTNFRKFAANGIATRNGDELSLATSLTAGRLTVGARYSDFRAIDDTMPVSNVNVSLGLIF